MSQKPPSHSSSQTNQLIHETSPYLLQHAHNPVEWYAWNEKALSKAKTENKPILLSIGYSACHWCHVMAHESFEDETTAMVMNELFINIKVDREERPDLDKIYQLAHQVLTQRGGGWPLTVMLEPQQHIPFFAGTYFPKTSKYGMPSFTDVLRRVEAYYRQHKEEINKQNDSLMHVLNTINEARHDGEVEFNTQPLDMSYQQLAKTFDGQYGGFGAAPKFPHPTHIERLLRHWSITREQGKPDEQALHMALFTLRAMAQGGMYDQLGGGFFRYSVDEKWMIPHFEKMLYDNGPLLSLCCQAWQISGEEFYTQIVADTADWIIRDMQSPQGGYYSTLDADSEGEEGKYYVWSQQALKETLNEQELALMARMYGLDRDANFEGHWHLHTYAPLSDTAAELGITVSQAQALLGAAKVKLLTRRAARTPPGRDEKIITAWNGLAIKAMAQAGIMFDNPRWINSAERAVDFIRQNLWDGRRLIATYKDGQAKFNAYLDDYAFLLDAVLVLLQARWRGEVCHFAIALAETMLRHYEDQDQGGFFFTSDDHETLIQRLKPLSDEAIPSGNGIAAHALLRLGYLLGEPRYVDAAQRTLSAAWKAINQSPSAYNALLLALEESLFHTQVIVLRGETQAIQAWQQCALEPYNPRRMCVAIPVSEEILPAGLESKAAAADTVAYICEGQTCFAPVVGLAEFKKRLGV